MNMTVTEPINIKAYNVIKNHLLEAYLVITDNSMSQAATAKEISEKKETTSFPGEDSLTDCTVSFDGSW